MYMEQQKAGGKNTTRTIPHLNTSLITTNATKPPRKRAGRTRKIEAVTASLLA
jgi:hypothetical protein